MNVMNKKLTNHRRPWSHYSLEFYHLFYCQILSSKTANKKCHLIDGVFIGWCTFFREHIYIGLYAFSWIIYYWRVCQHYNASHAKKLYEHCSEPVIEYNSILVFTKRVIKANRPDIEIKDYKEHTYFLIDILSDVVPCLWKYMMNKVNIWNLKLKKKCGTLNLQLHF